MTSHISLELGNKWVITGVCLGPLLIYHLYQWPGGGDRVLVHQVCRLHQTRVTSGCPQGQGCHREKPPWGNDPTGAVKRDKCRVLPLAGRAPLRAWVFGFWTPNPGKTWINGGEVRDTTVLVGTGAPALQIENLWD